MIHLVHAEASAWRPRRVVIEAPADQLAVPAPPVGGVGCAMHANDALAVPEEVLQELTPRSFEPFAVFGIAGFGRGGVGQNEQVIVVQPAR